MGNMLKMQVSKIATTVVMYHHGCADGFCSAAVAHMYYQGVSGNFPEDYQVVYFAVNAGEENVYKAIGQLIEMFEDRDSVEVLSFDLSMNYKCVATLIKNFTNVKIYDHHKCTQEQALDIDEPPEWETQADFEMMKELMKEKLVFKNDHSGAYLAFEHYYPLEIAAGRVPALVQYVEDRDIWKWALPDSKLVNAGLYEMLAMKYISKAGDDTGDNETPKFSVIGEKMPQFEPWVEMLKNSSWIERAKMTGAIVEKTKMRFVRQQSHLGELKVINGRNVFVVNATGLFSELGEYCYQYMVARDESSNAEGTHDEKVYAYDYILMWRYDMSAGKVNVSLRSRSIKKDESGEIIVTDGDNVNHIANQFPGGGGHDHAAGFECTLQELLEFVNNGTRPTKSSGE